MSTKERILVVDDEVNARTALAELLSDEGYDVETAADAFKALGKYETFTPHLILTDLKMPGMDGIELIKRVRSMEHPCAFVVMTAVGAVGPVWNAKPSRSCSRASAAARSPSRTPSANSGSCPSRTWASRRWTITARCGRSSPRSSSARGKRPSTSSAS